MIFNNTDSVNEKSTLDYTFIAGLYVTIGFLAKYYHEYFKDMNFEYDSDDEYGGVLCI
jgi:hypothetical protein